MSTASTVTPIKRDEIWVSMLVYEGSQQEVSNEYFGKMDRATFEGIVNNGLEHGFFKITQMGWIDERGAWQRMSQTQVRGQSMGYTQVAYFRIENLYRLILLDDAVVMRMLG